MLFRSYQATVPFVEGARRTMAWFDADPGRRQVDEEACARWDRLIDAWQHGFSAALSKFRGA